MLLTGMQNSVATLEISLNVSQGIRNRIIISLSYAIPRHTQGLDILLQRCFYIHSH